MIPNIDFRSKGFISLSITFAFLLILVVLAANQWMAFSATQKELVEEQTRLELLDMRKRSIDKLKDNETLLMTRLSTLQFMIPPKNDQISALSYFQSIFTDHNIQIIHLEVGDIIIQSDYNETPIKISLRGEYGQVVRLINDLRVGSRPFRIDELYMDREENHPSKVHCELMLYGFATNVPD